MTPYDKTLMSLTHTLIQVGRSYKSAADLMTADFHLSHASAWPVLMISRMGDGVRPGKVAQAVGIEPPSMVRLIDQLIDSGLVLKQDDPTDRRAKALFLTEEGKRVAERLEEALLPFRRELFSHIAPADVEACLRVLNQLNAQLSDIPSE